MKTDFRRASTTASLPQIAVPVYPDGAMNVFHRMAPVRALTATSLPRNEQHVRLSFATATSCPTPLTPMCMTSPTTAGEAVNAAAGCGHPLRGEPGDIRRRDFSFLVVARGVLLILAEHRPF